MLSLLLGVCLPIGLSSCLDPSEGEAHLDIIAGLLREAEDCGLRRHPYYWGKVVRLTKETITIQMEGRQPRTFPVISALASDRIPLPYPYRPGTGHRLGDVKLGDKVSVDLVEARDGFVCLRMGIYRRPGGKIPPAEEDLLLPEHCRMHNLYNTRQFLEETLIPAYRDLKLFPAR